MPTKRGGAGDGGSPAETQEETSNRRSKRTAFGSTDQVNLKAGAVPEINRGGAEKFVTLICGESLPTFQTFEDRRGEGHIKDPKLTRTLRGKFDDLFDVLVELNRAGAGVFLTINATKGKRRRTEDIVKVRSCFSDLDKPGPLPSFPDGLPPHIIVESSPDKYHVYWLVDDCPPDRFTPLQKGIIKRFDSDASVHDLPHVMRVPGFIHQKGEPCLSRIVEIHPDGPSYPFAQLWTEFADKGRKNGAGTSGANDSGIDNEDFKYSKFPPVSIEIIRKALSVIPADNRKTWVDMGMAVKSELGDDGFAAWDEWGKTCEEKHDADDARRVWDSITVEGGVTIGTLFHKAKECGWTWEPEPDPPPSMGAEFDALKNPDSAKTPKWVKEMNKTHFISRMRGAGGRSIVFTKEITDSGEALTTATFPEFRERYLNDMVNAGTKQRPAWQNRGAAWLKHPGRRTYAGGVVFRPGVKVPPDQYNTWHGFAFTPAPGDWSLLKKHIFDNVCSKNKGYYEYMLDWMARTVQQPGKVGEVAIVMRGDEGVGKGTVAKRFGALFGASYTQVASSERWTNKFNAATLHECIVLFADEAFWAGDRAGEATLKNMITESSLVLEEKWQRQFKAPNTLHLFMASNQDWVVPAGPTARRYFVLDVVKDQMDNYEYFHAIDKQMEAGGYAAMLHELMHRDISAFEVRKVPNTKAMQSQKELSYTPMENWLVEKLEDGRWYVPQLAEQILAGEEDSHWEDPVDCATLYDDFREHAKQGRRGSRHIASQTEFGHFLLKRIPGRDKQRAKTGRRLNYYLFPPLEKCRKTFATAFKLQNPPWPTYVKPHGGRLVLVKTGDYPYWVVSRGESP